MTQQVKNSKQMLRTLPENIKKHFQEHFEPITSAIYYKILATEDGGKIVYVPTFIVNNIYYMYVHDAIKGLYTYEPINDRQERQRKFSESVNRLMNEYGFSFELGKVIISAYSIGSRKCMDLCQKIQEVKEDISFDIDWKEQFVNDPKPTMLRVLKWYSFDYWLNIDRSQVFNALKDYLFAIN